MQVTPLYAAVFGLFFVLLSIRTVRLRQRLLVAIGDGNQPALARAVRVHANFAEYVPLSLLLVFFLEFHAVSTLWIHLLCIGLLAGRVSHAIGVSRVDENLSYRVVGMALTFTVIVSASTGLMLVYVF